MGIRSLGVVEPNVSSADFTLKLRFSPTMFIVGAFPIVVFPFIKVEFGVEVVTQIGISVGWSAEYKWAKTTTQEYTPQTGGNNLSFKSIRLALLLGQC